MSECGVPLHTLPRGPTAGLGNWWTWAPSLPLPLAGPGSRGKGSSRPRPRDMSEIPPPSHHISRERITGVWRFRHPPGGRHAVNAACDLHRTPPTVVACQAITRIWGRFLTLGTGAHHSAVGRPCAGRLAPSLTSTPLVAVAPPSCDNDRCPCTLPNISRGRGEGKMTQDENH